MKPIDLTGKQFGKWTVIEKAERPPTNSPSKPMYWKCHCECGTERIIPSHNLRCKRTLSCGCENALPDFKHLYNKFLGVNKKRISCRLSFQEFVKFTEIHQCHYCHALVKWTRHGKGSAYNLDRKNNKDGYSADNCVVCCSRCNMGKSSRFTYEEWYEMTECFRRKSSSLMDE